MPDRMREALFSMLASWYETPGTLPPLHVADVFAGSGSLGLEALSRGAASCVFFEQHRQALEILRENVDALQAHAQCTIVTADAWQAAAGQHAGRWFDLILLDPPYRLVEDVSESGPFRQFLQRLSRDEANRPLVVLHHPATVAFMEEPHAGWRRVKHRQFGSGALSFWHR